MGRGPLPGPVNGEGADIIGVSQVVPEAENMVLQAGFGNERGYRQFLFPGKYGLVVVIKYIEHVIHSNYLLQAFAPVLVEVLRLVDNQCSVPVFLCQPGAFLEYLHNGKGYQLRVIDVGFIPGCHQERKEFVQACRKLLFIRFESVGFVRSGLKRSKVMDAFSPGTLAAPVRRIRAGPPP